MISSPTTGAERQRPQAQVTPVRLRGLTWGHWAGPAPADHLA